MDFEKEYYDYVYECTSPQEKLGVQRSYLNLIKSKIKTFRNILDVGCGYGDFLHICDLEGYETYGIEVSHSPFRENFFDVITSLDVIEHLQESSSFLREIYRVLAKDGLFFCTTPNGSSWIRRLISDRDPTHINVHDQNFWREEFSNIGFNRIEIKGCVLYGFPPGEKIRQKSYIPSVVRPIFFPVYKLASELFIFARK